MSPANFFAKDNWEGKDRGSGCGKDGGRGNNFEMIEKAVYLRHFRNFSLLSVDCILFLLSRKWARWKSLSLKIKRIPNFFQIRPKLGTQDWWGGGLSHLFKGWTKEKKKNPDLFWAPIKTGINYKHPEAVHQSKLWDMKPVNMKLCIPPPKKKDIINIIF